MTRSTNRSYKWAKFGSDPDQSVGVLCIVGPPQEMAIGRRSARINSSWVHIADHLAWCFPRERDRRLC